MKTILKLNYFVFAALLFAGCSTGKNALDKGNYDVSVFKAIDRLKSSPNNEEAKYVVQVAYDLALKEHLRKIDEAKISSDALKWENILSHYQKINQLSDEINRSPAALSVINSAKTYLTEVENSKYNAAAARYNLGINQLYENNKTSAKNPYYNFEKAQYFYPNYKDVQLKLEEAYWAAVIKVVVQPVEVNSNYYKLSNQYFQDQINQFMANYQQNKFVIFYSEQQARSQKIVPNQVLRLSFDDFVVGQTYVKEKVEKLKKDSVVIGETRANGKVYGTVFATLSVFDKTVASSGLLDFMITDWQTGKIIKRKKLSGTFLWKDQWASYKGDERALTRQQLAMTKRREILPPAPATLFVEFTKPIYAQLVDEIAGFYSRY